MTKKTSIKKQLIASIVAIALCFTSLIGTTFAWFTDSVTSSGNVIQTGKLDVEMTWAKGTEEPETASWTDASQGAIFKNDKWEPGYAEARHIKITNAGTLALKYKVNIIPNGEVSDLADVIDVYYVDPAVAVEERADLDDSFKIGTLTEVLANMGNTATGKLLKGESDTITLVLKMREDAGNEYQEMSIGSSFSIQLLATQATAENDSWGDDYDADAEYPIVYIENADHDSTVDTLIQSGKVDVTVPAGASAGAYTLEASEPSKTVDADGNETVTIEITLKKDGTKVAADGTTLYTVSVEIGTGLNLTKVTHNGENVTPYIYDAVTGIITFETAHFSPFSFTYDLGEEVESVEDIYALVENGGVVQLNGDTTLTTDKPLEIKKDTVLNLNGYKLSGTSTTATTNYLIKVYNDASLIIQNGTVSFLATKPDTDWDPEGFPGYANNTIVAQGEVIINGVTVVNETAAGGASYAIDCYQGCDVTINDGSVIDGRGKVAIRMFANSDKTSTKVTVNGGTLTGTRAIWVQLPGSNANSKKMVDLTVNGGNLISTDKEGYNLAIYSYSFGDSFENTNITLNGGSFDGNVVFSGGAKGTRENVTIDWTKCSFTGDVYYYTEDAICEYVFDAEGLKAALDAGNDVILVNDIELEATKGGYSMAGIVVSGQIVDGNGKTLTVTGANGTWDCGVYITAGTVKNLTVKKSFRGIFTAGQSSDIYLDNVAFEDVVYTFNSDNGSKDYGIYISNSAMNGWTSFSDVHKEVVFTNCTFGKGSGYAFCRPYNVTKFVDCTFEEGYKVEARNSIYFENCTFKDNVSLSIYNEATDAVIYVDGTAYVDTAAKLQAALAAGQDVVLLNDIKMEAATTAPYGNKYGIKMDGGVLDGNGHELYVECYGDDYAIMTSGGTIKNLTIKEGCRAIMIMYAKEDVILDNVNIGGDGVLYPINTGEGGADGVNLIVTNSNIAGWTSYSLIESASFTNIEFGQGTYYNNIYGRVLKPYVNTTLTNCTFVEHMNLDLSELGAGQKVTMTDCNVNGTALTADVMTVPANDADYDTQLFTVDLPSWATSITDCIVFN